MSKLKERLANLNKQAEIDQADLQKFESIEALANQLYQGDDLVLQKFYLATFGESGGSEYSSDLYNLINKYAPQLKSEFESAQQKFFDGLEPIADVLAKLQEVMNNNN